jgi:hypothetical protein
MMIIAKNVPVKNPPMCPYISTFAAVDPTYSEFDYMDDELLKVVIPQD